LYNFSVGSVSMSAVKWLDEDEMRAWHSFLAAGALIDRLLDAQLKESAGLSHPQYEILVRLAEAPDGELRMTELAGTLLSSKSGLTYQVTQLEKAGLVERRSCPSDVRGVLAVLTEAHPRTADQPGRRPRRSKPPRRRAHLTPAREGPAPPGRPAHTVASCT
jgi:DNA-binding MarR family transcriptional regulator